MNIDQARVLRDALSTAIDQAEQTGATEVDLQGTLDATLGQAIDTLQAEITARRGG